MTKTQRRKERLEKHYATLERLSEFLGKKQDGKKLSLKLWKLEQQAHKAATEYCNGDIGALEWEEVQNKIEIEVAILFVVMPEGFFVNGDARGYALKIGSDFMDRYKDLDLHRDWGGNGVLSPEINGETYP